MQHLRRLHSHGFAEVNLICNARVTAPLPTVCGGPLIIIQPAAASDPVGPILSGVRAGGQGQRGQEDHGRLGGGHDEGPHWSQAPGRWRRGGAPGRSAHQYLHTCYANQSYNLGLCKRSHTQPTPKPAALTASQSSTGSRHGRRTRAWWVGRWRSERCFAKQRLPSTPNEPVHATRRRGALIIARAKSVGTKSKF